MGKAAVFKEPVSWYTGTDGKYNYCVGIASNDANRPLLYKEVNTAPVDFENLSSKIALQKQRKEIETNPGKKGYSENFILLYTDKDDLTESEFKYKLIDKVKADESTEKVKFNCKFPTGTYRYTFSIENDEEDKMVG